MEKPFKVTFGAVYGSQVDTWYFQSVLDMLMKNPPEGYALADGAVGVRSGPLLSQGRGHLLGTFHEHTDGDCLVMIDTDQCFSPELFWDMVACYRFMKNEHPDTGILAGVTWMSGHPKLETPMPNFWHAGPGPGQLVHAATYEKDHIVEVAAVGCSNLVVGRDVAAHFVAENINPFHHLPVLNWAAMAHDLAGWDDPVKIEDVIRRAVWGADQLGEDMSFCTRVRDAGFRIFVHTGLEYSHSKNYLLDGDDYRRAVAKAVEAASQEPNNE